MSSGEMEVALAMVLFGPKRGLEEARRALEAADRDITARMIALGMTEEQAAEQLANLPSRKGIMEAIARAEKRFSAETN